MTIVGEGRIGRAAWLLQNGYVKPGEDADTSFCWSQRLGEDCIYKVTAYTCECYEGQNKKRVICKHRWAAFAPAGVLAVLEMRDASTVAALEKIGFEYREALRLLEAPFLEKVREEYRKIRSGLEEIV